MKEKSHILSGGVVVNLQGLVAVVNHAEHKDWWTLPKGHVEVGEDILLCARREIEEETGLKNLELVKELGSYQRYSKGHEGNPADMNTLHFFLFKTSQTGEMKPVDPENPTAHWVPRDKVADILSHPKDKEYFLGIISEI